MARLLRPDECQFMGAWQCLDVGALIELPSPVRTLVQPWREIPSFVQFLGCQFYAFVSYRYSSGGNFPAVQIFPIAESISSKILREAYPELHLQHLS